MTTPKKHLPPKRQIIPLLLYTLLLCGLCGLYAVGSRYELFMQTLDTLWPVIGFTLLVVIVIFNALLLARGIRLWLLCGLHMILMGAWLAALQIHIIKQCRMHYDDHICGIIPPWMAIICLAFSTVPPLLGCGLLQLRTRKLQKAQEAASAELSFHDASDILDPSDKSDD